MYNHVVLISSDAALGERLGKALATSPLGVRLTRLAPEQELGAAAPALILWDDRAAAGALPAAARRLAVPVVRLGTAGGGREPRPEVVDTVDQAGLSKLVYVVRQRLAALHLRRARQQQAGLAGRGRPGQRAISNLLSSLLGNAELALWQAQRLPAESRRRLENVISLSLAMRELLAAEESDSARAA